MAILFFAWSVFSQALLAKESYYEILGVDRDATASDIQAAYRRLAKQYHPDLNSDPSATQRFKEIQHAYDLLSDEIRREAYDAGYESVQAYDIATFAKLEISLSNSDASPILREVISRIEQENKDPETIALETMNKYLPKLEKGVRYKRYTFEQIIEFVDHFFVRGLFGWNIQDNKLWLAHKKRLRVPFFFAGIKWLEQTIAGQRRDGDDRLTFFYEVLILRLTRDLETIKFDPDLTKLWELQLPAIEERLMRAKAPCWRLLGHKA